MWGHRGAPSLLPENTIESFLAATSSGLDGVELDVQLSRDGVCVVMHDARIERTTDGAGMVGDLDWAEIRSARTLGPGGTPTSFPVPRLEEVFEALPPGKLICIELKTGPAFSQSLVDEVLRLVEEHGAGPRVLISSFDQVALSRSHALCPDVPTALAWFGRPCRPWLLLQQSASSVAVVHVAMIALEDIVPIQEHGASVMLFGLRGSDQVREVTKAGVDAVLVDDPSWAHHCNLPAPR